MTEVDRTEFDELTERARRVEAELRVVAKNMKGNNWKRNPKAVDQLLKRIHTLQLERNAIERRLKELLDGTRNDS